MNIVTLVCDFILSLSYARIKLNIIVKHSLIMLKINVTFLLTQHWKNENVSTGQLNNNCYCDLVRWCKLEMDS